MEYSWLCHWNTNQHCISQYILEGGTLTNRKGNTQDGEITEKEVKCKIEESRSKQGWFSWEEPEKI